MAAVVSSEKVPLKDLHEEQKVVENNDKYAFVTGGSGYLGRHLIEYLVSKGWRVKALARSDRSENIVKQCGAIPVKGDLDSIQEMTREMKVCDVCFHCAAFAETWGNLQYALKTTKTGTINVIKSCKDAGVRKLIHVSTEQVLQRKDTVMHGVDENEAYPDTVFGMYGATKREAELVVLDANDSDGSFETVIVRPRWIWGKDDTKILPVIIEKTKSGIYKWIDGGNWKTSTAHVTNVCYAMLLCFEKGKGGEIYFVTDGVDSTAKDFVSDMLIASGTEPPTSNISFSLMFCFAGCLECCCCCGKLECCECCKPPFTQGDLVSVGRECTVNDQKIRNELGYKEIVSIKDGMLGIAKQYKVDPNTIQDKLACCKH